MNSTATIKIGQVEFINCLPINLYFEGLAGELNLKNIKIINAVPSDINKMILQGGLDIAPVSSYCYLKNQDKLDLFADLCISSDEQADSVLLFSRIPIEELSGKNILLSSQSATSNELLKIILEKFYKLNDIKYNLNENPDGELLIGDLALKKQLNANSNIYVYDLGKLWKAYTGLPMVFAVWVKRKDVFFSEVEHIKNLLNKSLEIGLKSDFKNTIKTANEKLTLGEDFYKNYFHHLKYNLGEKEIEGLKRFEAEILGM